MDESTLRALKATKAQLERWEQQRPSNVTTGAMRPHVELLGFTKRNPGKKGKEHIELWFHSALRNPAVSASGIIILPTHDDDRSVIGKQKLPGLCRQMLFVMPKEVNEDAEEED